MDKLSGFSAYEANFSPELRAVCETLQTFFERLEISIGLTVAKLSERECVNVREICIRRFG